MAGVKVHGLKELTRSFKKISKDLDKQLTGELLDAVEPVKDLAQSKALTQISGMSGSPNWATMKTTVGRAKGTVLMLPASRGRKYSRANLADLLLQRAMDPAVAEKQDHVVNAIDDLIGDLADKVGF
jgi:hypothetical protein